MLVLLSPSKTFTKHPLDRGVASSSPLFLENSHSLMRMLKKMTVLQVAEFYGLKDKAAQATHRYIQDWGNGGDGWPAAWSYSGETFAGFGSYSMRGEAVDFAQENVRIVSGLYGILRPLDLIMPYRLEMQARLNGEWGEDLYSFWNLSLSEEAMRLSKTVVVLASKEMSKAVTSHLKDCVVVEPRFIKLKQDGKTSPSFPKFSRGLMARWMCENRVSDVEELKSFNAEGYSYDTGRSTDAVPVFVAPSSFTIKGRFTKSA